MPPDHKDLSSTLQSEAEKACGLGEAVMLVLHQESEESSEERRQ